MKKVIIPIIIVLSFLAPCVAFYLDVKFGPPFGTILFSFILLHAIVRVWETFFTSQEKNKLKVDQDWSLIYTTIIYISLFYIIILEFYFTAKEVNVGVSILGIIFYLSSLAVKWWSMRVLGKQWAIHATGESRVQQRRLLKIGPYSIVRHPIYAATVIEQLGVILFANAFYSVVFFCFITLPIYYFRMKVEEANNVRIFGSKYETYKKDVGMFFPQIKSIKIS